MSKEQIIEAYGLMAEIEPQNAEIEKQCQEWREALEWILEGHDEVDDGLSGAIMKEVRGLIDELI